MAFQYKTWERGRWDELSNMFLVSVSCFSKSGKHPSNNFEWYIRVETWGRHGKEFKVKLFVASISPIEAMTKKSVAPSSGLISLGHGNPCHVTFRRFSANGVPNRTCMNVIWKKIYRVQLTKSELASIPPFKCNPINTKCNVQIFSCIYFTANLITMYKFNDIQWLLDTV